MHEDNDRGTGQDQENNSAKDFLDTYHRQTRLPKGYFALVLKRVLDFLEPLLLFIAGYAAVLHIIVALLPPMGELGFGGMIFHLIAMILGLVLAALVLILLRHPRAWPWPRLLADVVLTAWVVVGILGIDFGLFDKPVSPLHAAVETGHALEPGTEAGPEGLEVRDAEGRTPLMLAVREAAARQPTPHGRMALVRQLLARGADVNTRDKWGATPLLVALRNPELLDLIVQHGANPNLAYPESGGGEPCQSIWRSAARGDPDKLIALAEKFPDLQVPRRPNGEPASSPLYDVTRSAKNPHLHLVEYFLKRGFNPNDASRTCTHGRTPLHNVVHWPEPEARQAIDLLLAAGADVNHVAMDGDTPLMIAGNFPSTVRYLIERGADINAMDGGRSVLDKYLKWHHEKGARILQEAGAKTGEELLKEKQLKSRAGR